MSGVQSIERALDLLEYLAQSGGWVGVSELSNATGQPVATVHRLLSTLVARRYVIRDNQARRYALGPAFRRLAGVELPALDWSTLATPYLRQLVEISGETANLAIMARYRAVYVAQAQPPTRLVRMFTELGNKVPLHATGCGKVLLAYQPDSVVTSIIAQAGLPAFTDKTITDPDHLRQELELIRQRGYAMDNGEQEDGVRCLAVPVYGPDETVLAAMSISGPSSRLSNMQTPIMIPHLKRISAALTAALEEKHLLPLG
ncbi:IclR family transcriptional regulator [Thermosporothrix hazakensis]|uniref:Glycerol operon regulatory protein n=2 Tax=Thermosporothrix TaxID=768650 RepID=A0A326U5U8_THEHA|nr:IclR family transcriptional regulator [Thermosporothrix hazakensis]PZW29320.1 IclR family transcriptional regulator [Thermosporothrix hazakensis]